MKALRKIAAAAAAFSLIAGVPAVPGYAQENDEKFTTGAYQEDGKWYYGTENELGEKYTFEKVSHPESGAGESDGLVNDEDRRSQSYAWSAIESGDYIYIGTCYNSTYGIYWRAVYNMMIGLGKTPQEAMKIARDFVQFTFDDQFPETLAVRGIICKLNKKTGEITTVFDAKQSDDPMIRSTNTSGYRMAFEKDGKLYFVAMGNPTMFLLEVDPATDQCEIAFKRGLSQEGIGKAISAGMHGLIVYDDEIIMCFAGEQTDQYLDGEMHPEGGMIVASKDGRTWRTIADENDLGPSAYHQYDGLFGGGIWDVIEYNGHLYVTVVRDLTDRATGIVNKTGFAMYRGTKQADENFTWDLIVGEEENGAVLPNGLGCKYSMACNLWVYDGHLYLGTYNDPMLDFTAVAERAEFTDLYHELSNSIMLYRMDENEHFDLVCGKTSETFPERIGNLGVGLGDNGNQYVWRMEEHDGKLVLGTFDTTLLASAFTQLTDGQLLNMSNEQYERRVKELTRFVTSLGLVKDSYSDLFEKVVGSKTMQNLFNALQKMADGATGKKDPGIGYEEFLAEWNGIQERYTKLADFMQNDLKFKLYFRPVVEQYFNSINAILKDIEQPIYYFGVNYYLKNAERGFDLLISDDGLNFTALTRNGFGDPNNHGARTINSTDDGEQLYVGTANPYYGGQMWRLKSDDVADSTEETPEEPKDTQDETEESIEMQRLYNPNSGEHFYTGSKDEAANLVNLGWKHEGIGWYAPADSDQPVYRLYNKNSGDHHYTADAAEKNMLVQKGWKYEGIGWYSAAEDGVALLRAYNPNAKTGSHNYTANVSEQSHLTKAGWRDEGIGWFGLKK